MQPLSPLYFPRKSYHECHRIAIISQKFSKLILDSTISDDFSYAIEYFQIHMNKLSKECIQNAFKIATEWVERGEGNFSCIRSVSLAKILITYASQQIKENSELIQIAFQNSLNEYDENSFQIDLSLILFQKFHNILSTELVQNAFYNSSRSAMAHLWDSDYNEYIKIAKKLQSEILLLHPESLTKQSVQVAFKAAIELITQNEQEDPSPQRIKCLRNIDLAFQLLEKCTDMLSDSIIKFAFKNAVSFYISGKDAEFAMRILQIFSEKIDKVDLEIAFLNGIESPNYNQEFCSCVLNKYVQYADNPKFIQSAFQKAFQHSKQFLIYALIEQFSELLDQSEVKKVFENLIQSPKCNKKIILQILENFPPTLFNSQNINALFDAMIRNLSHVNKYQDIMRFIFNVKEHANRIENNKIVIAYYHSTSPDVLSDIQSYLFEAGSWRGIQLGQRQLSNMIETDAQNQSVAFEIHKYSEGLDRIILFYIKEILAKNSIRRIAFNFSDLEKKVFHLISDPNERTKCLSSIYKLKRDPEYSQRLECILPFLIGFLNEDSVDWNSSLEGVSKDERWTLWLKQFLQESAESYEGRDSISCTKGIYERAFTGFRTMHKTIDVLFLPSNLIRQYFPLSDDGFDPKIKLLMEKNLLKSLIEHLQDYINRRCNENSLLYLQSCCSKLLYEHIHMHLVDTLKADDYKDIPFSLKERIIKFGLAKMEVVKRKLSSFVQALEDIDLAYGIDPHNPILFTEMIFRIIYLIEKRIDPIPLDQAIEQELEKAQNKINENRQKIKLLHLTENEIDFRYQIQQEENISFIDLTR